MMLQLFAQALPATQRTARNFLGRTTRSYSFLYYSPAFKLSARPLNRVSAISFSRIRDVDDDDSFRAPPRPRREGSTFRDRARGRDDDSGRTAFRERSRGREEDGGRRDFDDGDRRAQRVRDLKERKVTSFARRGGDSGVRREYKEESKRSAVGQRIIASDEDYDDEASDDVSEPVAVQRNPRSRTRREEEGERRVNPADRVFGRRGEVVSDVSSIDDDDEEESAAVTDGWARDRRRLSSGRPGRDGDGNRRNDRRSVRSSGGRGDLSRRDGRDDWNRRPNPRGRGGDVSSDRRPDWRDRGSKGGDRRRGEESSSRREAWRDVKEEEDKEPVYGRYDGDHLYGVSPVLAALKNKRRKISELIVQEGKTVAKAQEREIVTLAKELGIPTREFEKHDLNMMSGNRPHQGFVLRAQPLDYVSLDKTPLPNHNTSSSNRLILALDEVMDPQNLGALLRTCHYLGCSTVVVSEKNSAPLSAVVSKASSGAMELMTVYSTKNMMTLLDRAKDEGWLVVGTAMKGKTCVAMGDVPCDRPVLLVLGNEGYGLRTNVQTRCDYLVNIPSAATTVATSSADVTSGTETSTSTSVVKEESERDDSLVDSLNVSVTGGILLHYFLNRSG